MRTVLVYLVAIGALATACFLGFPELFGQPSKADGKTSRKRGTPAVVVARVSKAPFQDSLEALGTVSANESVSITANRADHVSAIHFKDGQVVKKDDVLVEMHAQEEKAMLAEATAARDDRRLKHKRIKELLDKSLASERQLEAAKAALDEAEARVRVIQAAISDRTIRAPFGGVLGLRRISVGAFLQPSNVITTLDDLSVVKVDFTIPESWYSFVKPGMRIVAKSAAWPEEEFEGSVATIDTRLDPRTRSVTFRAQIPNSSLKLRPGMLLRVTVDRGKQAVLQVPEESLILSGSSHFVLRVDDQNMARRVKVDIGRRSADSVELKAGLAEGDRIVVEGIVRVDEGITDPEKGLEVKVAETRAAKPATNAERQK